MTARQTSTTIATHMEAAAAEEEEATVVVDPLAVEATGAPPAVAAAVAMADLPVAAEVAAMAAHLVA